MLHQIRPAYDDGRGVSDPRHLNSCSGVHSATPLGLPHPLGKTGIGMQRISYMCPMFFLRFALYASVTATAIEIRMIASKDME